MTVSVKVSRLVSIVAVGTMLLLPIPVMADSLQVFVGYADSLRPSGFFPSPFAGAPGVIYEGQDPGSASLDSGTVRIDNKGTMPITIAGLTVTLNPGTGPIPFSLWSSLVTLAPGQKVIYAQTAQFNFDSSDYGFLGSSPIGIDAAHPLGGCTNPGALDPTQQSDCRIDAPVVSFTENGKVLSFTDSGHILDTFGYDFIYGSSDGNESINWNSIGSPASRGGTATPEPGTAPLIGISVLVVAFFLARRRIRRTYGIAARLIFSTRSGDHHSA